MNIFSTTQGCHRKTRCLDQLVKENEYLKSYVEVEEANGSLFSKFILFLDPSHLNNTDSLAGLAGPAYSTAEGSPESDKD